MTAPSQLPSFDPNDELAEGTTVLEASAGTGKTFALAAATVRLIAEGVTTIDKVMLVTFARSASLELRSRVHERLQLSRSALQQAVAAGCTDDCTDAAHPAGGDASPQRPRTSAGEFDEVIARLCEGPQELLNSRLTRLDDALGDFGRATIATTHEFCARLLDELGQLVDHDDDVHSEQLIADLNRHAIDDALVATGMTGSPLLPHRDALRMGEQILQHQGLPLLAAPAGNEAARTRMEFASRIRRDAAERARRLRVHSFDDMVQRVVAALTDPSTGEMAARTLAARFDVVMVDEFQDTDPAQWTILQRAFHHRTRLVVVGDPKQAIYGFRGADVQAYLDATTQADHRFTLACNHRSDPGVIQGVSAVFGTAGLGAGGQEIRLSPVQSRHTATRLRPSGSERTAPAVQIRVMCPERTLRADQARKTVCADLVRTFSSLLNDAEIEDNHKWRTLKPADLAVLVRRRATGQAILRALTGAGIPAVFTGGEGIFASVAAKDWLAVLDAALEPQVSRLLQLSTTAMVGWSPDRLATATDVDQDELMGLVKMLRVALHTQGPAGAFEVLRVRTGLETRLLAQPNTGQRTLTDLRHLTERLDEAAHDGGLDLTGLREWLYSQIEAAGDHQDDEAVRRLETDLPAVSIMTVHKAKGLQFPVVALPDMADRYVSTDPESRRRRTLVHENGKLVLDIFGDLEPSRDAAKLAEEQAEDLRLLYVAATRAQSRILAWWTNTRYNTECSPLHRLVSAQCADGEAPPSRCPGGRNPQSWPLDRSCVEVVSVPRPGPGPLVVLDRPTSGPLAVRHFHDHIDRQWARTSYTGLTAGAHQDAPVPGGDDEPELGAADMAVDPAAGQIVDADADSLRPGLASLPGGTQFGSLVHSILEQVDPASPGVEQELRDCAATMLAQWPVAELDADALAAGLLTVLRTPLAGLTDGLSLADLGAANRLAEMEFEMPLGNSGARHHLKDLAKLWSDPLLVPPEDPLSGYGAVLAATPGADQALAGFLTGSIDVLLRVPQGSPLGSDRPVASDQSRFVVLDYKTNRLPTAAGEALAPRHYTSRAMARAMIAAHYPLQALLYSIATHRYLRQRLPGYRPELHLGGVGYLFVRGMSGPGPAHGASQTGVFSWHPHPEFIEAASQLLAGGDPS